MMIVNASGATKNLNRGGERWIQIYNHTIETKYKFNSLKVPISQDLIIGWWCLSSSCFSVFWIHQVVSQQPATFFFYTFKHEEDIKKVKTINKKKRQSLHTNSLAYNIKSDIYTNSLAYYIKSDIYDCFLLIVFNILISPSSGLKV